MNYYVGIDASLETVNVCVVDDERTVSLERKIEAEPEAIVELLKEFRQSIARLGLEAGPTASWLYTELRAAGLPAICMECRSQFAA
jgi:transposase